MGKCYRPSLRLCRRLVCLFPSSRSAPRWNRPGRVFSGERGRGRGPVEGECGRVKAGQERLPPRHSLPWGYHTFHGAKVMPRHATVADGVRHHIKCPKCHEMNEKPVAWFVDKDILPCDRCGHGINLQKPDRRRRIEEAARNAARQQAALTESGDGV